MALSSRFQFDKKLWIRFVNTVQPYFFPLAPKQTRIFLGLILVLLLGVIAFTFFLSVGLTFLGKAIFPEFFNTVAKELIENIEGLLKTRAPYIAFGVLSVSSFIFASQRRKLQGRWLQWGLLGLLLFLLFAVNGLNVTLSYAFRLIDTALNQRDQGVFWENITIYGLVLVIAVPIIIVYRYCRQKLGLLWREWLTKNLLDRYFNQRAYYQLDSNAVNPEVDNPDQRITQDVKAFTTVTLDFLLDILDSVLTLLSFTAILYSISKTLTWGLIAYATFGTVIAIVIGTRLIKINYNQLRLEANFRYGMVRVRDNAESIAFYQGEALEKQQVIQQLIAAVKNFDILIIWQSLIALFQYGYNFVTRLIPYIIMAPLYFERKAEFGEITQATIAFSQVLMALSFITNQIEGITEFAASINRLGEFEESLDDPSSIKKIKEDERVKITYIDYQENPEISLQELTLKTPNFARILIEDLSVAVETENNLLVMGASGSGKSSLLRAIAQLWTSGSGIIARPPLEEMLFLPQRPYMIVGTLREQLLYPNLNNKKVDDHQLEAILEIVNLPNLVSRFEQGLDTAENWENILSLGEQQRVAFARILVSQPRYAILDEATSALDVANEQILYEKLSHQGTTYISVGHRPTLKQYHQQLLEIFEGGSWDLKTIDNGQ
ncbi:ABC transporter domain protein [Rippkaea orientalis PCC 8801]|uniref:ABC transporter domain protein n=1 Tax=Rippkaea orientalis (strain PCC 8801 / RF-1) TaxID=41431 RepID=B7K3Q1_RIPO1|nr:ABC transporter ATP-binding protein/permease [Rippkaea orientalis]ACK65393.1 ABC transporter domain protein [Rippkaea orientalis PCC 8801]